MLHPATPIYEVLIGTSLLILTFSIVISIPTVVALWQDSKEQKERNNNEE